MLIYKIRNKTNGKLYVGQTIKTLEKRKQQHLKCARNGVETHLYQAIRKYGEDNFEFSVVCEVKNQEDLNSLERYYIAKYDCIKNGYNMIDGGSNNVMFLDDIKEKHDAKMRSEEVRNKISKSMREYRKKHPFSEEHRRKLSESAMGNKNFGNCDTRSIACYCIDDKGIRHDFDSYKHGGEWWFKNYKPFGEKYSQCTFQRKIIQSIERGYAEYGRGKDKIIITNVTWYKE